MDFAAAPQMRQRQLANDSGI